MREQKSRRHLGGQVARPDYTGYGNHGSAGNSLNIDINLGRRGHNDGHYYDNYGYGAHHYSHHDYGHYYGGYGHSYSGYYYPSYTYGYSNYSYNPYYYGRYGYRFGLGFGYSNYSYGYPGYYCPSSYYPSYDYYSGVGYTSQDYDYYDYPSVHTPVYYPTAVDEYLEPVIYEEDLEEEVLDEVDDDPFDDYFYEPLGLSQDLSGSWIWDYTYAWPSWDWCGTFAAYPTAATYYSGSSVLY